MIFCLYGAFLENSLSKPTLYQDSFQGLLRFVDTFDGLTHRYTMQLTKQNVLQHDVVRFGILSEKGKKAKFQRKWQSGCGPCQR